jgi:hypothetical protein
MLRCLSWSPVVRRYVGRRRCGWLGTGGGLSRPNTTSSLLPFLLALVVAQVCLPRHSEPDHPQQPRVSALGRGEWPWRVEWSVSLIADLLPYVGAAYVAACRELHWCRWCACCVALRAPRLRLLHAGSADDLLHIHHCGFPLHCVSHSLPRSCTISAAPQPPRNCLRGTAVCRDVEHSLSGVFRAGLLRVLHHVRCCKASVLSRGRHAIAIAMAVCASQCRRLLRVCCRSQSINRQRCRLFCPVSAAPPTCRRSRS